MTLPLPVEAVTASEEETQSWAARFAALLSPGDVVALIGPLGAGKTAFAKGVARAYGVDPGSVHSPTYALALEYPSNPPLFHMDLYRLPPGSDPEELGLSHYWNGESVGLVEWPDRLQSTGFTCRYEVSLDFGAEESRILRIRQISPD